MNAKTPPKNAKLQTPLLLALRQKLPSAVPLALMSLGLCLTAPNASAELLAYEGFNYPAGSTVLPGQAGGFGWAAPWQAVNGTGESVVAGNLVGAANAPAGYDARSLGNSVLLPNGQRDGRFLDTMPGGTFDTKGYLDASGNIGADGKTIYLSFLQQPNGTTLFYEFEFHRLDLGDPGRIGGVGNDRGGDNVNLRTGGTQTLIGPGSTNVSFYVVRIDFKEGNDDVRVYMNPTSATEPATPTLTLLGASDMSFNGLSMGAFVNGRTLATDEIRVGETWEDALGVLASAPVILSQPQDPHPVVGESATFTVEAGGSMPLSYYWLKNGAPLTMTSTGSLTLTNVQLADAGNTFSVIVSNRLGTVTSAGVTLTVLQRSTLALGASANNSIEGGNLIFTATVGVNAATASDAAGTVSFQEAGFTFTTVPVTGGQAVLSTRGLAAGSHSIIALYSGDAAYTASTSSVVTVSVAAAQTGLPPGTVAYYTFNGSANDASPYGNDLQATTGSPQFTTDGPFGPALLLDGGTILGTASGSFPAGVPIGSRPYTVACFVKADPGSAGNGGWIGYGSGAVRLCNNFRMNGFTGLQNYWWAADLNAVLPNGGDFRTAWHSVVGTWDGTTRKVYVDGLLQTSDTPLSPSITSETFMVGKTIGDSTLTGWLSELAILNRAIVPAEVRTYHQYGLTGMTTNGLATSTLLVASPTLSPEASNITFTATIKTNGTAAVLATGTVVFQDGVSRLGSAPLTNGQAVFNTRGLAAGVHTLTAEYNGDATFASSTSAVVNVTVTAVQVGLPAGTVAYYRFNGSGVDSSIYGNDLEGATGTPQYRTDGPFGGALFLDGSTTLGTVSGAFPVGVPVGANPYTVACFVKADPSSSVNGGWIGYGSTGTRFCNNFRLGSNFTSIWNYWWAADVGADVPNGGDFTTGWHSVVGTWDGTTRRIYIDGKLQTSDTPGNPAITSELFEVGKTLGDANLTGSIAELLIANRAFTAAEIQTYTSFGGIAPSLGYQVTGNQLKISWRAEFLGWMLQTQTNGPTVGLGTHWDDVAGTATLTSISLPINPASGSVFYRLRHP